MKRIFLALMLFFVILVSPAWLFAGPIVGSGTRVIGECSSGLIAQPSDVASAAQWTYREISDKILQTGQVLGTELRKNSATMVKLFENQNSYLRDLFVGLGAGQEQVEAIRVYGERSVLNSHCNSHEAAGRIQVGKSAEKEVSKNFYDKLEEYNTLWSSQELLKKYNVEKDITKIKAENLIPKNKTLTAEQVKDAKAMTELILNPIPELQLTEKQMQTLSGRNYTNVQKIKKSKMVIPQAVHSDAIAAYSPSTELGEWVTDTYHRMGGTGTPESVVDGKISSYGTLNIQTSMRYANPNWHLTLTEKNEVALLRELLSMTAVQMEMQRRQLELTQMIALLLAQQQATNIQRDVKPAFDALQQQIMQKSNEK